MSPSLRRWMRKFLAPENEKSPDPTSVKKLGKYEILDLIGSGGMGVVYRARDPVLERDVALKILHQPLDDAGAHTKQRFLREARAIARLSHANIVVIYEIDLEGPTPFIAMEYLQGDDLKASIDKQLLTSTAAKLDVLVQIAAGLEHAHGHGVLHRDVKPANVMVLRSGLVKLTDFGLALISSVKPGSTDRSSGTPAYMSPEQFQGQEAGPGSDVFSFGVVAFELLTGRKPFVADNLGHLAYQIISGNPAPFEAPAGIEIPRAVKATVLRCLAKSPEDRYPSFSPVISELRALADPHSWTGRSEGQNVLPHSGPGAALAEFSTSQVEIDGFAEGSETPGATAESIEIVFRKVAPGAPAEPAPGEVHLIPRAVEQRGSRDMAAFVLARGVDELARGPGPPRQIVVQADPTLDDLLAASFALRLLAGHDLPKGAAAFARYAAIAREGMQPGSVPVEESLEGVFLAVRNAHGDNLAEPVAGARFAKDWARMAEIIFAAAEAGRDPFDTPLFAHNSEFARERAFLLRDRDVYRQDVLRGERWLVSLPGGPPASSALLLRRPKSLLWKHWSRRDTEAPFGGMYLLLAVWWEPGQWVFSTDPVQRLPILSLTETLQKAELAKNAARASTDPWFDGAPFGHTLAASPRAGALLEDAEVLEIVRGWSHAQRA